MAHAGTPGDLARQPATSTTNGLWQALLVAVVLFALVAGMVFVGTNLAAKGSAVPAGDHRYDTIEAQRGAAIVAPAVDGSYNQVEQNRGGALTPAAGVQPQRGATTAAAAQIYAPAAGVQPQRGATTAAAAQIYVSTAPDNSPRRTKGHIGAMIDQ